MSILLRIAAPLLIVSLVAAAPAGDGQPQWDFGPDFLCGEMVELLPGAWFFPTFLENFAADTTLGIEESNGFALLDHPRVYLDGEAMTWTRWRSAGGDITSGINPGAPGILFPLPAVKGFFVDSRRPGGDLDGIRLDVTPRTRGGGRFVLSGAFPRMGGLGPGAETMILNHPFNRADRLYETRRRFNSAWNLSGLEQLELAGGQLVLSLTAMDRERSFNDFNQRDQTYTETGRALMAYAHWRRRSSRGALEIFSGFNALQRSAMDAELGRLPQETADLDRRSLMGGFHWSGKSGFELRGNLLGEKETRTPGAVFSKEMQDNDGDGMWPETPLGNLEAWTLTLEGRLPLSRSRAMKVDALADVRRTWSTGTERAPALTGIVYDGQPWLGIAWADDGPYRYQVWHARAGVSTRLSLSPRIEFMGDAAMVRSGVSGLEAGRGFAFWSPEIEAGLVWRSGPRTRLALTLGMSPVLSTPDVGRFLESRRPLGSVFVWEADRNGDGLFQPGEGGEWLGWTGGAVHSRAGDLSAPRREQVMIEFSTPLSRRWMLDVRGMLKRFRNLLTVAYDGDFGTFVSVGEQEIYQLNRPVSGFRMENSTFTDDPFYAQLRFTLRGRGRGWLFSFSFMAHMGMGSTAFGNGPVANDLGTLSELQADPNLRVNSFGRVDGDRAFVARLYAGFDLGRHLFLAVSMKYRDGNPFAFIDTVQTDSRRILLMQTIRAEDSRGRKGGPREDYLSDCSLQLSWSFPMLGAKARLTAAVFNLLDFGSELSEYVFSGGSRDAMELQIPRSLRLSLSLAW